MIKESKKIHKSNGGRTQFVAVAVLGLVVLGVAIFFSGIFSNFSMGPNSMSNSQTGTFSTATK